MRPLYFYIFITVLTVNTAQQHRTQKTRRQSRFSCSDMFYFIPPPTPMSPSVAHALNIQNTSTGMCFLCPARPLWFLTCQTQKTRPNRCVFCVWRVLSRCTCAEHAKHPHWGVFWVFGMSPSIPHAPNMQNTPIGRVSPVWCIPFHPPCAGHGKHTPMGVFFVFGASPLFPYPLNTKNMPQSACFSCLARPLLSPTRRTCKSRP